MPFKYNPLSGKLDYTVPALEKATGADINDGINDAKYATSKAIADSKLSYTDGTETLTNKTINVDSNTVSNIETDNFKTNVIDTDSTFAANSDTRIPTQKAVKTVTAGKENYHGVQTTGAITFDAGTHILTVATGITYWYKGVLRTNTGSTTCDIDSFETLTANTLYYFYFDDASGTLKCNDEFWDLKEKVSVATVFWNGSAGAVQKETHSYTRDVDWHQWAHLTVGARYGSGLGITYPTAAQDASLQIETGVIYDEDLSFTTGQCTTMRGFYKASANVFTYADYSLPYLGASGDPYWLDTDDYTLKSVDDNKYVCYWVYATTDQDRPIYIIPTHAADTYSTVAQARAESTPVLSSLNLAPEMKLIYRFIYKGDGQFQEYQDYRLTSPLPAGGAATITAGAVVFTPTGNISSTSVQGAIEELDNEKANLALSNLASVAINTSLVSDTDNTDDLGSSDISWKDVYARTIKIDGATSGTVTLQGAAEAGTYSLTLPTNDGDANQVLTTNGSGVLSWTTNSSFAWNEVTGTSQSASIQNGYICNNAGLVTVTLPDTAAVGSVIEIAGKGAGGWKLQANAGETIKFGNQTTSAGGSLASTAQYDCLKIVCITADTTWVVTSSVGNITVA